MIFAKKQDAAKVSGLSALITDWRAKLPSWLSKILSFAAAKQPLLGIDVTSCAIKILALNHDHHGYTVTHYAIEKLPPGAVIEKEVKQPETVIAAIKRAINKVNYKGTGIAIAMPSVTVITKMIQMDANLSEHQLENIIEFEAEKYIPHPMENVRLDFHVIGPVDKNPEQVNILLIASLNENVEERVNIIKAAGLEAKVVDVESYAVERAATLALTHLPLDFLHGVIAVFDIGANMMSLNVMANGQLVYTHEESFGGNQLTQLIQQRFGLSFEQAEQAKLKGELSNQLITEQLLPLLQAFQRTVLAQVQRFLQFFLSGSLYNKVDYILLSGGVAATKGLAETLQTKLDTPVTVANPFQSMSFAASIDREILQQDSSSLMVVTGLAMRSFD